MNTKTTARLILVGTMALAAVGGFYYFSSYIYNLTEKTSSLREEVESAEIKMQHDQLLSKSAQNTSQERQRLSNLFIKQDSSIDFVSMVEKSAGSLSLNYDTNQIENVDTDALASQNKQLLRISMTVSGGWKNVISFLEYIESLPYAVKVEKVDLSTDLSSNPSTVSAIPASGASAASATTVASSGGASKSTWKLSVIFSIVKIKDDAR